jgi:hypothetical protein
MPYRWQVGRIARSTSRFRIEYGCCSIAEAREVPPLGDPLRPDDLGGRKKG